MDLAVGSLEHPEVLKPVKHFGLEARIPSFAVNDGLPGKRTDEVEHIVEKWKAAYGEDASPGRK